MIIGIVGHEGAKFSPKGELDARSIITSLLTDPEVTEFVSGGCHLGGIDIWAEEIAASLNLPSTIYLPDVLRWEGEGNGENLLLGFKERNLQIAYSCDIVHCIVVSDLPSTYRGRRFSSCYHCDTDDHVKSGGCWTAHRAPQAQWHIVSQLQASDS